MTTTAIETHTLDVPGVGLSYDIRPASGGDSDRRPLLIVGSPMDAAGFVTLASHFSDRTVVTYDGRGTGRSKRTETGEVTPEDHASDLHAIVEAIGGGPIDLFGSSGGAVNGLALVARHPELVHTFVAHEPPVVDRLPDRDLIVAVCEDIYATYQAKGMGPAMAKFFGLVSANGPLPEDVLDGPDPDPAMFGLPTEDDGSREDPLLGLNMRTCCPYVPDYDALAAASTRIVFAVGKESNGQMAHRGTVAVSERLGQEPVVFPSDHGGFLGGEYGQTGDPDGFAAALHEVLDQP
jgi:pimeloyl-ACP methyl ester carboxylesterase